MARGIKAKLSERQSYESALLPALSTEKYLNHFLVFYVALAFAQKYSWGNNVCRSVCALIRPTVGNGLNGLAPCWLAFSWLLFRLACFSIMH